MKTSWLETKFKCLQAYLTNSDLTSTTNCLYFYFRIRYFVNSHHNSITGLRAVGAMWSRVLDFSTLILFTYQIENCMVYKRNLNYYTLKLGLHEDNKVTPKDFKIS